MSQQEAPMAEACEFVIHADDDRAVRELVAAYLDVAYGIGVVSVASVAEAATALDAQRTPDGTLKPGIVITDWDYQTGLPEESRLTHGVAAGREMIEQTCKLDGLGRVAILVFTGSEDAETLLEQNKITAGERPFGVVKKPDTGLLWEKLDGILTDAA